MLFSRVLKLLSILVILGLSACATTPPAPVEDRTASGTSDNTVIEAKETAKDGEARTNANTYIVQQNENLYRIGLKTGIDYREIAQENNIEPPYNVRVGQVLVLPKPAQMIENSGSDGVTINAIEDSDSAITATTTETENTLIPTITSPKRYREPYSEEAFAKPTELVIVALPEHPTSETKAATSSTTEVPVTPPVIQKPALPEPVGEVTWAWPHQGEILRQFGDNRHQNEGKNNGLDIAGKVGQPIKAAADGKVIYSGSDLRGYGKLVIIKHNKLYLSVYAHNSHLSVRDGETVKKGQKIAELGSTEADRPKLHFEIRREGQSIDPQRFLPKR